MKKLFLSFIALVAVVSVTFATPAFAQGEDNTTEVTTNLNDVSKCFGKNGGEAGCAKQSTKDDLTNLVRNIIRFIAMGVGAVIVLMFGYAGFLYLTAGGNSNQIVRSKSLMGSVAFALFLYIFGLALMNWLIPGGVVGF